MPITSFIINDNYREILNKNSGAEFMKVDLHIHTPASGDAQAKNKYNFKFDITNIPASLISAKQLAEEIVKDIIDKGIKLIAITDHNSPSNTHPEDLTNTWYQLIKDKAKGKDLCVLPGVEISTDDLHILVILNPKEEEPAAFTTHRINFLLQDCKFSLKEYGDYRATGMSSLFDVLKYMEDLSTNCIAIPAHIDGGRKAMLTVYQKPSNVFNKLLNHPNLNAVEVVKDTTAVKKKIGKKSIKEYFESLRDKTRSPIAFIQNSDGHSIKEIGKRFTYIRMGEPGFWSLKNAMENPETRVRLHNQYKPIQEKTRIIGIAFNRGKKWDYIAFNSNLNCIIGKKRTNKSIIIDLILFGLNRFEPENKDREKELIKARYSVNVFIAKKRDVFCYSRDKSGKLPSVYLLKDGEFSKMDNNKVNIELPRKYNQETIKNFFSNNYQLMDFLDRRIFQSNKLESYISLRDEYLTKFKNKNFNNCGPQLQQLEKICKKIYKERKKHIKKIDTEYGKNFFQIKIQKGKWKGRKEQDYYDRVSISVLVNSRYKSLNRLNTGERNSVMMVLLMNQGIFGPLIIDEPEQYLDVKSIIEILVPRIRKLKNQQQIICVTRDEHILVSGDAEQVIATQSENKLETISGDINNCIIQKQILEIFEGDGFALLEKSRKLHSILEEFQEKAI